MPDAPDPMVGRTIGGCRVLEKVGRGAMAVVYRAEQISLDRVVALKVLDERAAAVDDGALSRFFREARSCARLIHPNVVQVYDVGLDQGVAYIVMEFVEGETLFDRLRREGKLPAGEALDVVRQAALALVRAQEFGIVHRDIKPANLMISRHGEVKLADFGLAKALGDSTVTRAGVWGALGTPYYMSPEQASGGPVDARSDIYSLGATLYHLLTGRPPFQGGSTPAILIAHATERPVPACKADPSVPRAVSDLADRMLEKSPSDRYSSAKALLAAIAGLKRALAEGLGDRPKPRTDMNPAVGLPEKRSYRRVAADFVADVSLLEASAEQVEAMKSQVKNLSRGGLFVESAKSLPVGSVVRMAFRLSPRSPETRALGVVRWTSLGPGHPGMGVQFLELDKPAQEGISGFVSKAVGPAEALKDLTRTPGHEAFLRLHAASVGDALPVAEISRRLGTTQGLVRLVARPFAQHGFVALRGETVEFLVPPDDELAEAVRRLLEGGARGKPSP